MKKGTLKQAFAMFLAMTLLFTSVPTNVFASTMQDEEETLETEVVLETEEVEEYVESEEVVDSEALTDSEVMMEPEVVTDEEVVEKTETVTEATTIFEYKKLSPTTISITSYTGDAAELTIPSEIDDLTVTEIGASVFYNHKELTKVVIPDTVTKIGRNAFERCSNLTTVDLSEGLLVIDDKAFYYCSLLTDIILPAGLKELGSAVFFGCSSLQKINIPKTLELAEQPFSSSLTTVTIEDGIATIPASLFFGCSGLVEISIPDSVTVIGNAAFKQCKKLKTLKLPKNLTMIDAVAFQECVSLQKIELPTGVTTLRSRAFSACTSLEEVTIPKSLVSTDYSFEGCNKLTKVNFEEGTTMVAPGLFRLCTALKEITIPDTVTAIGRSAFSDCSNLSEVVLPDGLEKIGDYAFYNCSNLSYLYVPHTVTEMGYKVFNSGASTKIYCLKDRYPIQYAIENGLAYEAIIIPVEELTFEESSVELMQKKKLQLEPIVNPELYTDVITWTSSDKSIATVSKDGLVTATNKLGKTVITATAESGVTASCTIEVVPVIYDIKYVLDGGKNHKSNPATYYKEMSTIKLKNPTKTGYTFKGWYSDSKFKTKVSEIKKGSTGNKTLYAKWAVNKYNISFNGNKATSGKMSALADKKYGSTFALTKNTFKRTGYKFVGWNTKADGKGTAYTDGAKVKNLTSSNGTTVTLYAQWEKQKYSITYKLDGGKNSSKNPTSYTITTSTIKLQNPTKTNYTFGGWYSDSKFKNKVSEIKKGSTGTKTFYAKWIKNKYAIKFDGNGATSGKMSTVKDVAVDKTVTLTNNAFKKTGYKFVGWNTKKDGKGDSYTNKQKVKGLSKSNGKTVTLYAQWEKQKYSISYKLDGGKNNSKNPANYTITTSTIKLQNPTKTGYTFKGWYSDSKLTKKVNEIKKGSTGSKTLYAKWAVNKYNIKFNGNGSTSGKMSTLSNRTYNKSYTLPTNAYKRTGYEFTGWNTKADGTGKTYANKASVKNLSAKNAATVTLYAQWSKIVESNFTFGEVDYGDGLAVTGLAEGVKLTKIEIPASYKGEKVTTIAQMAFEENKDITSVVIPEGITGIYNFSFANCTSITELVLPDSVTKIYNGAFMGCTGLTSIELPDDIEELVACPFGNCTNLTSVVYKGVTYTSKSAIYAALEENGVFTTNAMMPFSGTGLAD